MRTATSTRTTVLLLIGVLIAAVGLVVGAEIATSKPAVAVAGHHVRSGDASRPRRRRRSP